MFQTSNRIIASKLEDRNMSLWKLFIAVLCSIVFSLSFPAFSAEDEGTMTAATTTPMRLKVNIPYSELDTDFPPWPQDVIIAGESVHRDLTFYSGEITVEIYESKPLTLRVDDFPIDEFVTVISGKLILTVAGEEPQHFEPGDSVLVPKGFTGVWEMQGNYRELLVVMGKSGSVTKDNDVEKNKKTIIENVEIWNNKSADGLRRQFHPRYVASMNEEPPKDAEAYISGSEAYWSAFPDVHVSIHHLYAENNVVVKHWSMKGTHTGDGLGMPATGRTFEITNGISTYKFENGLIKEYHVVSDNHSFFDQLGLLPKSE